MNPAASFRLGLITNLTNVKAAVYAVAFLPAFVPKDFSLGFGIFIFGGIWAFVSITWNIFLIWTVKKSAIYIQKPIVRRILTGISAVGIMFLAIGLALSSGR
jgi:threonine/homoserine/homoserine lactone efflux protein